MVSHGKVFLHAAPRSSEVVVAIISLTHNSWQQTLGYFNKHTP